MSANNKYFFGNASVSSQNNTVKRKIYDDITTGIIENNICVDQLMQYHC